VTCRSNIQNTEQKSISLPKSLLERAQKDFITLRKNNRSSTLRDIEERDFHKWLLLTRLQARSRIGERRSTIIETSSMAKVEDWENALRLDEALQAS
jgi:pyruvate carboxylase